MVAVFHRPLGNEVPFDRSLQIFNLTPLPNFAPSPANTKLQGSSAGFMATFGALFVFMGELTQQLGTRGIVPYFLLVLIVAGLWYGLAYMGEWRRPPVAFIALLGLQLFGAAYYWSSFRTPASTLATPFTAFDFHTHTTRSSGLLSPQQQIDWHRARGFKGLAFTDSDTMIPADQFAALQAANSDMILLNGCEYRGPIHLIFLGIKTAVSARQFDMPAAIKEVKRQGGIVIVAHPWWPRDLLHGKPSGKEIANLDQFTRFGVDGVESWNGIVWNRDLVRYAQQRRLLTLTATDTLSKSGARCYTWTLLPLGMDDESDVLRALKMRKVAAAFALNNGDTPPAYDAAQKQLKRPKGLIIGVRAAWNSLARAQRYALLCSIVIVAALSWAWGAERGRKPLDLQGPKRVVGFLRKRRIMAQIPSLLLMILAWAGSIAAAVYCLSWTERVLVPGLTPAYAILAWLLCDVIYLYGRSLWHRAV